MKYSLYRTILLVFLTAGQLYAQESGAPAPASDKARRALAAVEANMDSAKAHRTYIYAMGLDNPDISKQYEAWFKKFPKNVNIPLAAGTVYFGRSMPEARAYLLRAAEMDPMNAKIWAMLSADANMRGDSQMSIDYILKAMSADPYNASYAYGYLLSFEDGDAYIYTQKVFEFVGRFPHDPMGAQALYWLGERTMDLSKKIFYLEELRKFYPPKKFHWSASGMVTLADAYMRMDAQKALALSTEMQGEDADWEIRKQLAELLVSAEKREQSKDYSGALEDLQRARLPHFNYVDDFMALKKAELRVKTGDIRQAYDSLAVRFAKLPSDALYHSLLDYGQKLAISKGQIDLDIEKIRYSGAVPAFPFELGLYTSDNKLSLAQLKGQVTLLTFWFPGCGPCKEEFPHFQAVVDSFNQEGLAYVGINVVPSQDGYVLPFLKNSKFSFVPLRGSFPYAEKNYGVSGAPSNFLIDKNGIIVFKDFTINHSNRRTLELMISSLLEKE